MKFPVTQFFAVAVAVACPSAAAADEHVFREAIMGCEWTLRVFSDRERPAVESAAAAVFARIRELDATLSDYRADSELSRLNATAGSGRRVPVSGDLWTFLEVSRAAAEESDGSFDVTVGRSSQLWRRSRRRGELPDAAHLAEAVASTGWRALELHPGDRTVSLTKPRMRLDPGGIGKGQALDEGMRVLREGHGITRALLDAGGQVLVGDPPPGRDSWRVAVQPVDGESGSAETVIVRNASVSTSGDAWQFARIGGQRFSHIIDPKTGLGLTRRIQVTAIAPTATVADWTGTAVAVMGPDKGLAWLAEHRPEVRLRIVTIDDSDRVGVTLSPGWEPAQREASIRSANSRKK